MKGCKEQNVREKLSISKYNTEMYNVEKEARIKNFDFGLKPT